MFRIQPSSGEPIYLQLMRQIKHAVATGGLEAGSQLPTVRELAERLVVNPNTIARAYRELEREGVLETGRGRGTFVRREQPRTLLAKERSRRLQPFIEQLVAEGRALGFEPDEIRAQLDRALDALPRRSDDT